MAVFVLTVSINKVEHKYPSFSIIIYVHVRKKGNYTKAISYIAVYVRYNLQGSSTR